MRAAAGTEAAYQMHADDFDLLAAALASEHRDAMANGPEESVVQAERIALTIADAIASRHPLFDPVKFMLAACDAAELGQLTTPVARQVAERFGTSKLRPRLRSGRPRGLNSDEAIDTSWWHEDTGVDMVLHGVSSSQGVSAAAGHLMNASVRTLGQLLAMSDEELRAIPGLRMGPVTTDAIHKVRALWRAKQPPDPEVVEVQPSADMQTYTAGLAARVKALDYPGTSLATGPVPGPGGPGRPRGRATPQSPPGRTPGR
jgi:hypothetical protein